MFAKQLWSKRTPPRQSKAVWVEWNVADQYHLKKITALWISLRYPLLKTGLDRIINLVGKQDGFNVQMPREDHNTAWICRNGCCSTQSNQIIKWSCKYSVQSISGSIRRRRTITPLCTTMSMCHLCNFTFEVHHCPSKQVGAIPKHLADIMAFWSLEETFCTKLLRDGESNAVATGDHCDVPHMSCIQFTLWYLLYCRRRWLTVTMMHKSH